MLRAKVTQMVKGRARFTCGAVDKGPPTAFINSCSVLSTSNLLSETNSGKRRPPPAGRSGDYHSAQLYHTGGGSGWDPST